MMEEYGELFRRTEELFCAGRAAEGLEYYGREAMQSGDVDALQPLEGWLHNEVLLEQAGEAAVCGLLVRLAGLIDCLEEERRERIRELCIQAVGNLKDCEVRQDTTDRYVAECILYRHMGRTEDALRAALEGMREHGTAFCAIFAGLCYLDLEETERAEEAVRKGLELDPGNGSGCNDLADYFFNRRRWGKAEEYYRLALDAGDRYDCEWAEPSWLFCRYMIQEDAFDLERLAVYAAAFPDNARASGLCGAAREERRIPYVDYIPQSPEAVINFLREMRERKVTGARMALTCQEAASSINAVRLTLNNYHEKRASFEVIVSHIPDPPLDTVEVPEGVVLWSYGRNHDAVPALGEPSDQVRLLVKELAASPFYLPDWYKRAGDMADLMKEEDYEGLYACMVYPPRPDEAEAAEEWLMRVQYAAVCILARLGSRYIRAQSDVMQRCVDRLPSPELARICLGQLDWPVIPALTLLAWQVKEGLAEAEAASEVLDILYRRIPGKDYCFFEHALICAFSWIPGHNKAFYENMRARRRKMEEYD